VNLRLGIGLMLAQQCLFTIDTLSIHALGGQASLWQIGEIRALWAVILALALAPSVGWRVFGTVRPCLMAVRVAVTSAYAWVVIWSFSALPLGDATALDYTVVLYVVLLAGPMLGEAVGLRRYAAAAVGIAGAMLVIRPGVNDLSWVYIAVLLLTSLNGIALCLNRLLQRDDSPVTIFLYVGIANVLMFAPGAFEPLPPIASWPWLLGLVTGPLGMFAGIVALRYAEASQLAPITYVRLLLATAIGAVWLAEPLSTAAAVGSIVIVTACVLAMSSPVKA
jgi:drug/metabolite transporter (DMT)-like permease